MPNCRLHTQFEFNARFKEFYIENCIQYRNQTVKDTIYITYTQNVKQL